MWNFNNNPEPFGPEVKSQRIKDFLEEPEIATAPTHLEAYEKAELRYRKWVQEQRSTAHENWLNGADHGACPCGYTFKSTHDREKEHGRTCMFSPDYDEVEHLKQRTHMQAEARAMGKAAAAKRQAFPRPPAYIRNSRTSRDTSSSKTMPRAAPTRR